MPANFGGADVRHLPAAEEDEAYKDYENVVQEVVVFSLLLAVLSAIFAPWSIDRVILLYKLNIMRAVNAQNSIQAIVRIAEEFRTTLARPHCNLSISPASVPRSAPTPKPPHPELANLIVVYMTNNHLLEYTKVESDRYNARRATRLLKKLNEPCKRA